jgi:hypothetical protein
VIEFLEMRNMSLSMRNLSRKGWVRTMKKVKQLETRKKFLETRKRLLMEPGPILSLKLTYPQRRFTLTLDQPDQEAHLGAGDTGWHRQGQGFLSKSQGGLDTWHEKKHWF